MQNIVEESQNPKVAKQTDQKTKKKRQFERDWARMKIHFACGQSRGGFLHHEPWSRPKALRNLWLVVELVPWHSGFLHQGKKHIKVTMKFEVPVRHMNLKGDHEVRGSRIIDWHGPTDFAGGEAKEVLW